MELDDVNHIHLQASEAGLYTPADPLGRPLAVAHLGGDNASSEPAEEGLLPMAFERFAHHLLTAPVTVAGSRVKVVVAKL